MVVTEATLVRWAMDLLRWGDRGIRDRMTYISNHLLMCQTWTGRPGAIFFHKPEEEIYRCRKAVTVSARKRGVGPKTRGERSPKRVRVRGKIAQQKDGSWRLQENPRTSVLSSLAPSQFSAK